MASRCCWSGRRSTALEVADRVAFIENGAIRHEANPAALAADPEPLDRCVGVGR